MAFTKTTVDRAFLRQVAIEHLELANVYERGTNAEGAAQLRAVANMLYRIADHEGDLDIDADEIGTVLPKVTASEARPPEPEKLAHGALVVVKAIGEIKQRIDGPKLAYVVDFDQREFMVAPAPRWANTRTVFVLPDEVSPYTDAPTPLPERDRKALQAWIDHLLDDCNDRDHGEPCRDDDESYRGNQILERLLGR